MAPDLLPEALRVLSSRGSPFSELGSDLLESVISVMHPREYRADEHLIRQGDPGQYLVLIVEGSAFARVHQASGDPITVGEFGPGDVVGEMSLITNAPRAADVIATRPVRSLVLSASDFQKLADSHPELRVILTNVVADRLGRATHDGFSGKDVHGYRIVRCAGRGGMGIVYQAIKLDTSEIVAIKMMSHRLLYQPAALQRFRREAETLKSLQHRSIARLYDRFEAYQTQFLVMEFCEGTTVDRLISPEDPVDERVVRRIVGQLAGALQYVHSRGLVHSDLKPSNVMLGSSGLVKLLDFGLAKFDPVSRRGRTPDSETVTHPVAVLGTLRYMAPEQFAVDEADYRADLYGLACVAYEMLAGRPLIDASDLLTVIEQKLRFVLPSRSKIGRGVTLEMHEFLARGLEHRPERRTIDLNRLASWAGPAALQALARPTRSPDSTTTSFD